MNDYLFKDINFNLDLSRVFISSFHIELRNRVILSSIMICAFVESLPLEKLSDASFIQSDLHRIYVDILTLELKSKSVRIPSLILRGYIYKLDSVVGSRAHNVNKLSSLLDGN